MKDSQASLDGPRLCFVGSMVGRNPGHITQQGLMLSDLFAGAGYVVTSVSAFLNRYRRLTDILATIARRHRQIDILVLEVYGGPSFFVEDLTSWLSKRFGLPVVMWLHGGALPDFMDRFPRWTRRVLARADVIVTPTEFLSRAARSHGFDTRIIPNVIQLSNYQFRHRRTVRPRLFWMRSFHDIWNPTMAVRVLNDLLPDFPEATLHMAGPDKGGQSQAQDLARALGLSDRLRFVGFINREGKASEGSAADIFINTNRIDNAPIAVIEACAMGLPVVTTAVGGIPDLLTHRQTALLVPDNDDQAMARAIKELIENPDLAESLSRNGRQLAQRFSWEQVRPQWDQVFNNLMTIRQTSTRMHPTVGNYPACGPDRRRETIREIF